MSSNSPILAHFNNIFFVWVGKPDFREGKAEKKGQNWKKLSSKTAIFLWKNRNPSFTQECHRKPGGTCQNLGRHAPPILGLKLS